MSENPAEVRKPRSIARRVLLAGIVLVLAAGAAAPLLNANRFRGQIQSALESALNRHVSLGSVRFNLFTGPGFTVQDVLIDEGPGMGFEPFAHVDALEARIRLTSLWTGHLSFSNLKLIDPSVNFVKKTGGSWNIQPLLDGAAAAKAGPGISLPEIQIREGRLNFKFDDTKSVFYIANADLDLFPNENGDLVVRFSGEPSRTDHTAQGLGRLVARGLLRSKPGSEAEIGMSVQLEQTAIPELARLFDAQDFGVRGLIASNLKLDGPLSKVNVSGNLRIEDIHRWDLMPNKGEGWTLNYAGFLNIPAQQVEIETRAADREGTPVNGKFVASSYLTSPKWEVSLSFHDLPAASLAETARHMGAPFPAGGTLDARLNGEIGYSRPGGMKGELILNNATFKFPQGGATDFETAPLEIVDNHVRFGPTEIRFDDDESVQLEAHYVMSTHELSVAIETKLLDIAQTKSFVQRLLGTGSVPFLERCRQGAWKGTLVFGQKEDRAGEWTGDFELQGTQMEIPGIAAPVRLSTAVVQMQNGQVQLSRMRGRVGAIVFDGEYRFLTEGDRPDRMRLSLGDVQLAELERLMLPTLSRQSGFLARALKLARTRVPDWLGFRSVEGTVQAKSVQAGDAVFGSAKGHLVWNGTTVLLTGLESKLDDMEGSGKLAVNLNATIPQYKLTGQFRGIEYRDGALDLDGVLETSGIGADLLGNAHSDGAFSGSHIGLGPDAQFDEVSGEYHVNAASAGPKLVLTKVQLTQGQDLLRGQGASQADGRLVLELTSGRRQVRMTGMLLPLRAPPSP